MSLETNLANAFQGVANNAKALRMLLNGNAADLAALTTTNKLNLVGAINELVSTVAALSSSAGAINDASMSSTTTWSSTKTNSAVNALLGDILTTSTAKTWSVDRINTAIAAASIQTKNDLVNGSAAALDTLKELADALGGDANFAATTAAALGKRLRFDAAQVLSAPEKAQACANIGVGDPERNFLAVFTAGLA